MVPSAGFAETAVFRNSTPYAAFSFFSAAMVACHPRCSAAGFASVSPTSASTWCTRGGSVPDEAGAPGVAGAGADVAAGTAGGFPFGTGRAAAGREGRGAAAGAG